MSTSRSTQLAGPARGARTPPGGARPSSSAPHRPAASPATTTSPIRPRSGGRRGRVAGRTRRWVSPPPDRTRDPLPGTAGPGPVRPGTGASRRPGGEPADRRSAIARLGRQAGPGHEGADHRLGEEEGPALEDRRMDAPAGRGSVSVRPPAIYDPMSEPCPPTPRADAYARSAWAWCARGTSTAGPPGSGGSSRRSGTRR